MARKGKSKAQAARAAKTAKLKAGGMVAVQAAGIDEPTPEQMKRVEYRREKVKTEMGHTFGTAYRRHPLFQTMAKQIGLSESDLAALNYYRTSFDRCQRSPMASSIANMNIIRGGGTSSGLPNELANATVSTLDARERVAKCEALFGNVVGTMRAVALEDRSFSDIAVERFGGRAQNWIIVNEPVLKDGKPVIVGGVGPLTHAVHREKIVPKSGRHREIIRQEFFAGVRLLAAELRDRTGFKGTVDVWVELEDDGCAVVEVGQVAPHRRYRLWGARDSASALLYMVKQANAGGIRFPSAAAARAALDAHNAKLEPAARRLVALTDQEMLD